MRSPRQVIRSRFGGETGLARLLLAYASLHTGRLADLQTIAMAEVNRIVFACLGNLCRSPFAEQVARSLDVPAVSIGISSHAGRAAFPAAARIAAELGYDLSGHRTSSLDAFTFERGDLVLAMEIDHARALQRVSAPTAVQVSLLGLWGAPRVPYIHDPFGLSDDYFRACFARIETSVRELARAYFASKGGHECAVS